MRIGIEVHDLEGQRTGVGRVLINILRQWDNFDLPHDLRIILYFKQEIPDDLGLKKPNFEFKLLNTKSNALFMHWSVCWQAYKDKLDLLFCPAYISPILYPRKTALFLHDIIYQVHPELYNWPSIWDKILLQKFSKISAKKAKLIFTPSEFSRQEVIKYYQVEPNRVLTTLEAADQNFKQINNQDRLEEIKKKYQIKNKFIFYIGSIFKRRHLPEAIKAFEKIVHKLPNYQFLVVGTNYTNQKLTGKSLLRHDYLKKQDLVALYNAADLIIYLSDYEGFGLPVLESMACGTPVVTSQKASLPEVAGESAIYVKDNTNIQEISEAIAKGLTNQPLREDLIKRGLEQAKKFSWQRCAQQILDALLS
ncbi:MAG: hypothetical protein CMI55_03950 [Parcubacteria group bacterium]|jgi:glycosyltransferase involved in cell wall biosynthesis|nr:hypothetical protein [Parcubacteria group bacterium]|tara:strand:+ start:4620 stop:5711 length:1092 start_codon:yes stop_codon:yes gene_type:complete